MSKGKKIAFGIVFVLLLVIIGIAIYVYSIYHQTQAGNLNYSNLSVKEGLSEDVVNIAIFGIDGREGVDGDRTDVIMIATIDLAKNEIKLTSIMRDTFVRIEENDGTVSYQKINAAYSLGTEELTIKTINQNFDMNISEYVTVNFNCVMDLVDAVGGVEVNVENEDVLYWTNQYLMESNAYGNRNDPELTEIGTQTLTGAQALAYSRNRYSDSDYGRTARQREVVNGIFNKVKNVDTLTALNLINKIYPYVTTSLDLNQMTSYATAVMAAQDLEFQDFRIPTDEYGVGGYLDEVWYLFPNTLIDNARVLHEFIYGSDNVFEPSEMLTEISSHIADIVSGVSDPEYYTTETTDTTYEESYDNSVTFEDTTYTEQSHESSEALINDTTDNTSVETETETVE